MNRQGRVWYSTMKEVEYEKTRKKNIMALEGWDGGWDECSQMVYINKFCLLVCLFVCLTV